MPAEIPLPEPSKEPLRGASEHHLYRYHAYPSPVIRDGLQAMVSSGDAPAEVLNGPDEFHVWSHQRIVGEVEGVGGSPWHIHPKE